MNYAFHGQCSITRLRHAALSHHRYTPVDELRLSSRFASERGTNVVVIWHPHCTELLVSLHDESW